MIPGSQSQPQPHDDVVGATILFHEWLFHSRPTIHPYMQWYDLIFFLENVFLFSFYWLLLRQRFVKIDLNSIAEADLSLWKQITGFVKCNLNFWTLPVSNFQPNICSYNLVSRQINCLQSKAFQFYILMRRDYKWLHYKLNKQKNR